MCSAKKPKQTPHRWFTPPKKAAPAPAPAPARAAAPAPTAVATPSIVQAPDPAFIAYTPPPPPPNAPVPLTIAAASQAATPAEGAAKMLLRGDRRRTRSGRPTSSLAISAGDPSVGVNTSA